MTAWNYWEGLPTSFLHSVWTIWRCKMVWPPQCIKFYTSSPVAQRSLQSCPFLSSILGWLNTRAATGQSASWSWGGWDFLHRALISRVESIFSHRRKQKREHDRREKERKKKRKEKFKEEERLQLLYKDLHMLHHFLFWCTQQEHGYEEIMLLPARRWKKRRNWLGSRRLSECRPQSEFQLAELKVMSFPFWLLNSRANLTHQQKL